MSNKSQRGTKPQKKTVAANQERGLDAHFNAALQINPLATVCVGALHGINSFLETFMLGNPPVKSLIAVNIFLGRFFITLGESYISAAKNVPGFDEVVKELDVNREANKSVSTSQIIVPSSK